MKIMLPKRERERGGDRKLPESEAEDVGEHEGGGVVEPDERDILGVLGNVGLKEGEDHVQDLDGIEFKVANEGLDVLKNRVDGLDRGFRRRPAGELGDQLGVTLILFAH